MPWQHGLRMFGEMMQFGGAVLWKTVPHGPGMVIGGVKDCLATHSPSALHTDGLGLVHVWGTVWPACRAITATSISHGAAQHTEESRGPRQERGPGHAVARIGCGAAEGCEARLRDLLRG